MKVTISVTTTGAAIEVGSRTVTMSRHSETFARLLTDYGVGTHALEWDDTPAYVQMWAS